MNDWTWVALVVSCSLLIAGAMMDLARAVYRVRRKKWGKIR
jgi:hypothetical protein